MKFQSPIKLEEKGTERVEAVKQAAKDALPAVELNWVLGSSAWSLLNKAVPKVKLSWKNADKKDSE